MSAGAALDKEITDLFALLAVLLVFVFAYLSALLPVAEDAIGKRRPEPKTDRVRDARRVAVLAGLLVGLCAIVVLVALLLVPLTYRSFVVPPANDEFPTLRWGLRLVDFMLALVLVAATWLTIRLVSMHRKLTAPG